jgi:stalled ribosome rescue protein Dom34
MLFLRNTNAVIAPAAPNCRARGKAHPYNARHMTDHYHALVWIDHREARVFQFDASDVQRASIRSEHPDQHIHHKANSGDSGHAAVDKEFLKRVAAALSHAGAILITGPASAKTELAEYIRQTQPHLAQRISAVQSLDHPSDGELIALARSFFKADDRMHPQTHR